jgi:hypothetical protein
MRACGQLASPPNPRPSDAYRTLGHILPTVATADNPTRREPINKANDREPVALIRGVLMMTCCGWRCAVQPGAREAFVYTNRCGALAPLRLSWASTQLVGCSSWSAS